MSLWEPMGAYGKRVGSDRKWNFKSGTRVRNSERKFGKESRRKSQRKR